MGKTRDRLRAENRMLLRNYLDLRGRIWGYTTCVEVGIEEIIDAKLPSYLEDRLLSDLVKKMISDGVIKVRWRDDRNTMQRSFRAFAMFVKPREGGEE